MSQYTWNKWVPKKPTRKELLVIITELQGLIGEAWSFHNNDRDAHGFEKAAKLLETAHNLCIEARAHDRPTKELNIPVICTGYERKGATP